LNDLGQSLAEALRMILTADRDVTVIVWASLRFSISSTILASLIGIPAGIALASSVYTLIMSRGPLGQFHLLFSPAAIIIGQTVLILPLVASLACSSVSVVNPVVRETALTLGAGRLRTTLAIASEAQSALMVACITAFGRVLGEIGISLILGGNIQGYTRTITTAISLQTSKGEFALGLALGIILLFTAFLVNFVMRRLGRKPL
jgi:tungstate transport system permease protein